MSQRRGERTINSLESRFGHLALPNILRWFAIFQVLCFALTLFSQEFLFWIEFHRGYIFAGQVWRAVSWVFFPVSTSPNGIFIVLIAAWFTFFISDSIENAWQSFRFNLHVFASLFLLTVAGLLLPDFPDKPYIMRAAFFSNSFLAFCSLFPNQTIMLMLVIPVKAKWLGWANAAILVGMLANANPFLPMAFVAVVGLLPYLLVFIPTFLGDMKQSSEAAVRRHKFQSESGASQGETFHLCQECGATEVSNPEKEFRVTADGDEYCVQCRKRLANS